MASPILDRAETFLQSHGRILERRLFEHVFRDGGPDAVRSAVLAYQNADGGFGSGLEPDVRSPLSTALHCEIALYALSAAGVRDPVLGDAVAGFLDGIAEADARVPIIVPEVLEAPHAQHWDFGLFPPPSPNPTASLAGLLAELGASHAWLAEATRWTWERLEQPVDEGHELLAIAAFLERTPDRERAIAAAPGILGIATKAQAVIQSPESAGYGVTPLQIFPRPDALGASAYPDSTYSAFLDELARKQQEDGGWPIAFDPVGAACEAEWRARFTLEALTILKAWNRL